MKINYNKELNIFTIENVFGDKISREIMNELIFNKDNFKDASVGSGDTSRVDKNLRTNSVLYFDELFKDKRNSSKLLSNLEVLFANNKIRSMLDSSVYPFTDFTITNHHETQASRYGDNEQFYTWHIDRMFTKERMITFVYYPQPEPFNYSGGEIQFSPYPIVDNKPLSEEGIITIKPKHDFGLFFTSTTPHRVLKTKSPETFEDGRFSINCWIGMK